MPKKKNVNTPTPEPEPETAHDASEPENGEKKNRTPIQRMAAMLDRSLGPIKDQADRAKGWLDRLDAEHEYREEVETLVAACNDAVSALNEALGILGESIPAETKMPRLPSKRPRKNGIAVGTDVEVKEKYRAEYEGLDGIDLMEVTALVVGGKKATCKLGNGMSFPFPLRHLAVVETEGEASE